MKEDNHSQDTPWAFVSLMAVLMSFGALAIDSMMPALAQIGKDLQVPNPNDVQLIISSVFIGMGFGLLFFGPLSDSYGRKFAIYLGIFVFIIGCLVSIYSQTFNAMIFGRILQGLGAASCRVVTLAMIRDKFSGPSMAKIMSFIMIIFIIVPALAPSIGQLILFIAHWRIIFVFMLILGLMGMIWLRFGQEETLAKQNRLCFSIKTISNGIIETIKNRTARGYTLVSGLIFGAFVAYLSTAQQIFQDHYKLGDLFPIAFGCLAITIGLASFQNSRWVDKYGMEELCLKSMKAQVIISTIFLPICYFLDGTPPLFLFFSYLSLTFFCVGILFGNINALALEPLGHIAGVANSVISSLQTFISVAAGAIIAYNYNGTVLPLTLGFFLLGICSLILLVRLTKKAKA